MTGDPSGIIDRALPGIGFTSRWEKKCQDRATGPDAAGFRHMMQASLEVPRRKASSPATAESDHLAHSWSAAVLVYSGPVAPPSIVEAWKKPLCVTGDKGDEGTDFLRPVSWCCPV